MESLQVLLQNLKKNAGHNPQLRVNDLNQKRMPGKPQKWRHWSRAPVQIQVLIKSMKGSGGRFPHPKTIGQLFEKDGKTFNPREIL